MQERETPESPYNIQKVFDISKTTPKLHLKLKNDAQKRPYP